MALSLEEFMTLSEMPKEEEIGPTKQVMTFEEFMGENPEINREKSHDEPGYISRSFQSFTSGLARVNADVARIPALAYGVGAIPQNALSHITGWNIGAKAPDWMVDNPVSKYFDRASEAYNYRTKTYGDKDLTALVSDGKYADAGDYLTQSVIENAPQMLAQIAGAIAGVSQLKLLSFTGAQSAAGTYAEARSKSLDELEAVTAGILNGSFEAVFEKAGTFGLLDWGKALYADVGKQTGMAIVKNTFKYVLGSTIGEGTEELWTQLAQDFTNKVYEVEDIPWRDFPRRAVEAAAIGSVSGAAMTAPGGAMQGLRSGTAENVDAQRAKAIQTALNPDKESQDGDVEMPESLSPDLQSQLDVAGALESVGVNPEAISDISESYQAAIEEGQDSGEALQSALNDRGIELTQEKKKIIEDTIQVTEERQGEALTPISKVDQSERGLIPQFSNKDVKAQAKLLRDRWIDENPGKKIPSLSTFEDTARETMEDFGRDIPTVAKGLKQSVKETSGQVQTNEKMVTERRALRESLRAQSRAALEGFRSGKSNIQDIKRQISNELKRLPKKEQGFLTTVLAQAKTPKDVAKAIVRIDQRIEEVQRRDAASQLKRELQRLEASNVVAIDYKQKIREATKGISLSKPRAETIERLNDMREFIDRERAAGKDIEIPSRILAQLNKLSAKPVSDMSLAEIEDLRSEIQTLADLGKTKLRVRKDIDRLRKERDLKDILAGSTPIETSGVTIPILPGERLSFGQKLKNKLAEIKNFIQNTDIAITPTDAIIDHLDGDAMYQGPNYRIFKSRVDAGFSQYMDLRDEYRSAVAEKAKGLRQTNFERIGVYAIAQQDGGLEKLKNNGLTEADIPTLTDKEMEVYRFMREQMDASFPVVAEVMKRVHNVDVGQVKGYFPFMTNWELMAEDTVNDRILSELVGMRKNVERGFTKSRVGAGDQRVQTDAMDVYLKHMDDVAYLVTLGEDIKYLGELANSPKYAAAVGDAGQKMMREWIDVLARKGGSSGAVTMPILDRLRINLGLATFAFKIGSAAIQLTAIGQGAAQIGTYAFKGAYDVTSRRWRDFVMDNMPELRNRVGDDIAFREFKDQTPIQKLGEIGLYPMKALDQIAASSVAIGAYQKYLSDNNLKMDFNSPDQKGIEYAQRIVRRSQSSGLFKDTPLSLTRGKLTGSRSLDRALFQFQSFALTEWSVIRHELWDAGIKKGDVAQSAGILFWLLMTATAETALRNGMKQILSDSDDDKGVLDNFWLEILSKIPFVGQIMSSALYDSNPVPVLNFLSSGASGILSALNGKTKGTRKRGAVKVAGAIGRAAGIPGTAQAEQLARKTIPKNKGGTSF